MASRFYRGRHRKPTHTGRNLVTVGAAVSVSGAFLPVGVADARVPDPEPARGSAGTSVLDAIAECESNGNPRAFNGVAHYGKYQFDIPTWRSVGGTGNPRDASVAEQDRRAQMLLERRGTQPWNASKACWSRKVGAVAPGQATTPRTATAAPRAATATPRTAAGVTGQRAADGSGRYVCAPDKLYFEACDPGNLGQVVDYPLYGGGRHRAADVTPAARPAVQAVSAPAAGSRGARIVSAARSWIGTPYRYGGTTRAGLDCSALVQNALRTVGVTAPRTSRAQSQWVQRIPASQARPGDLVFFYSPVSHVGIVTGPGRMIDASRPGRPVAERAIYPGTVMYGRIPT